ncbi:MAG: exo-alpha-sialidase [Acidimicrobiales bacterium]
MRQRVVLLVVFGMVAVVGASGPVGAKEDDGPPTVLPSIQLTTDNNPVRIHNQPQVLVDPTDEKHIVVIETDASVGECWVHVSLDGGRTWTVRDSHPRPPQFESCFRPSYGPYLDAKFGADGVLYVSSAGSHLGPPFAPYVARSDDLGDTWQFATLAAPEEKEWKKYDGTTVRALENYQATRMAVSPANPDVVVAGFAYFGRGNSYNDAPPRGSIFISTDGGRTFGPRIDPWAQGFPADKGGIDYPTTVINQQGTIFVFSKERPPASTAQPPPGHRMHLATSSDGGKTWTTSMIDETPCAFCITPPNATIDLDTGALYVVFERTEVAEGTDRNIFFIRSADGGKTWSERVKLNDDPVQGRQFGANQYHPGVSVAPNGRITVAWHDFRNDILFNSETKGVRFSSPDETYWDVYATSSNDGGRTWAPNVRVSDRSMNRKAGFTTNDQVLFGPMGVAATNRAVFVAWADSRAGTPEKPVEDTYFTAIEFAPPATGESTAAWIWLLTGAAGGLTIAGLIVIGALARTRAKTEGRAFPPVAPSTPAPPVEQSA